MSQFYFNPHALPYLITAVLYVLVGGYVLQRAVRSPLNISFAEVCLSCSLWLGFTALMFSTNDPRWIMLSIKALYFGVSFISVSIYTYSSIWLGYAEKQKKLIILGHALGILFSLLICFTPWVVSGYASHRWGHDSVLTPLGGGIYLVFFGAYMAALFRNFWRGYREAKDPLRKRQAKLVLIGFFVAYIGVLDFLPSFGISTLPIGGFTTMFLVFALAYTILRYNLLDVKQIAVAAHRDKLAAIGTLATSINHEIRNPLYIIQGLAQSCLANVNEGVYASPAEAFERSKEVLSKVAEQAERAMSIMRGFAAFAKRGIHEEFRSEGIPLNETLEGILPLVRHELELDKIELSNDVPEDLSPIQADKHHIEQIFFNLIVNACQAMKETGGKMAIEAAQHDSSIQIEVKDNGPGIAANRLGQIFEPFYTTKEEGTGLGLYVTKQLVERNGGKISVKSKPGEGTTFALEFKK